MNQQTNGTTNYQEVAIIEKKKEAWGNLGVAVHQKELQLQATAQELIMRIATLPTQPSEIKEAEATYKEFRADALKLQEQRKEITGRFDEVSARLMQPEKSLTPYALAYSEAIIKIKKSEEARVKAELQAEEGKKNLRLWLSQQIADIESRYRNMISKMVAACYEYALGAGDIKPADLPAYITKCKAKLLAKDFSLPIPDHTATKDPALYAQVKAEFTAPDAITFQKQYIADLTARFSDYTIAYANKEQAIELAKKEAEAKAKAEKEEADNKAVAQQLEAAAIPLTISTEMKALKKVFKIQMEETANNAVLILSTCVKNWVDCAPKIRITKWFNFSVQNAIVAIEGVKNSNPDFAPAGITFIEVDKL